LFLPPDAVASQRFAAAGEEIGGSHVVRHIGPPSALLDGTIPVADAHTLGKSAEECKRSYA
jgi:hypothetical protein